MHQARRKFRVWGLLGKVSLLTLLASCVAQEQYDEMHRSAKHYQKEFLNADRRLAELEAENATLRQQLDAAQLGTIDASFNDDIDRQLEEVQNILAQLGDEPGDVTKFAVDGGYVYRVKDSILFDLGSTTISDDGREIMMTVAEDIRSRPHGGVYVRGHTDNVPVVKPATLERFPHGNLQLSAARAVEVAALLIEAGKVDKERVIVMGFGPNDPVNPNTSAENRQKNRRVDIFVADETASSEQP